MKHRNDNDFGQVRVGMHRSSFPIMHCKDAMLTQVATDVVIHSAV